jgi:hypothetical protein
LIGDPLYTPYKVNAPLRLDGVDELTKRMIEGPIPLTDQPLIESQPADASPTAATQ